MGAVRTARSAEGRFVQLANSAGQDPRLSLEARGVLYFVLSLPPRRTFTARWLVSQVPNGRESVRKALAELADCGYLTRVRRHDKRGRWVWEQVLSDAPTPVENPVAGSVPCDGNPSHGPTRGNTTFAQVGPCDGKPSDGMPSHKELIREVPKTKHVPTGAVGTRTSVSGPAPEAAAKDKTLSEFGKLARSRSDVPDLRPGAVPYRALCHRCCQPGHQAEHCATTSEGTTHDIATAS